MNATHRDRSIPPSVREALRADLFDAYFSDLIQGCVRTSQEYAADFPGFEDWILESCAMVQADLSATNLFADRYLLSDRLATGGAGDVYIARQLRPHRQVAIKLLRTPWSDPTSTDRFRREADLLAQLEHPGILPILEAGQTFHLGAARDFLVTPFIQGSSWKEYVAAVHRDDPTPWRALTHTVALLCDALDHAHRRDVLHRDIKPSNVLVRPDGSPVLIDFGIAKSLADEPPDLTPHNLSPGTPAYMAPEAIRGEDVDRRSDLWSVGVLLYESLANHHPFSARTMHDTTERVLHHEPKRLRPMNPHIPRSLACVVRRCLAKRPEGRYDSGRALASDLRRILRGDAPLPQPARWASSMADLIRRHPTTTVACLLTAALSAGWWSHARHLTRAKEQTAPPADATLAPPASPSHPLHQRTPAAAVATPAIEPRDNAAPAPREADVPPEESKPAPYDESST